MYFFNFQGLYDMGLYQPFIAALTVKMINFKRINTEAIKPITCIKLKAFIVLMDDLDSFML
ncbi:MAG: hypothetical protein CMB97_07865 [Flavobacteriaceae bacterium]|nr:hypothetical protein [Flavobacteriaceae bacterium]